MYVLLFIVAVYSALVSGWAFLLKLHFVDFVALIFWVALMAVAIGAKMTYSGSYRIFGPQLYAIGLLTLTIILGAGTIAVVLKPALAARVITNIASSDYPFLSSHKAQIVVAPLSCLYVASLFVTGILRVSIPSIVMDLLLGCTVISMVVLSGVPTFEALWSVGIVLFFLEVRYRWTKKLLRF
jgi:hypothetical protein